MEIIVSLSIVIAVVAVLTSIVLVRRVKKQIAEMTDVLVDVKNGNGNRRILSATNELTAPLAYAFEIIVRKYYQSIYLFCCRRLNGDPDTAADITQDVFLKLLENIQSVRKIGKFQNYLLTIAVNTCNNYTKKAKPLYMDLETLEDIEDTDNAFEKIELNELKAQIQYAINTLPDYQKEVIILRFYYDLKIREIATITKASVSTVKSRLQQGIKKLERYLADFRGGDNV